MTAAAEFIPARAAKAAFDPARLRLVFLRTQDAARMERRPHLPAAWKERIQKAAVEALESLKKPEHAREPVVSVDMPTTEGGGLRFVLIDDAQSLQEIHTGLRKSCEDALKKAGEVPVSLDLESLPAGWAERLLQAVASLERALRYEPTVFGQRAAEKTKGPKAMSANSSAKPTTIEVVSRLAPVRVRAISTEGRLLGEALNRVRELADLPANELTPAIYRKKLEAYARAENAAKRPVEFKFLDTRKLKELGAGSFLAVCRADPETSSGLAHLIHRPKAKKPAGRVVLVGKGLCFDTGGYNVKTGAYMNGMHRDMTGSAVAWALFDVLRELHPELEIHACLGITENLISETAYHANEVVTAMDGTSIEVVDTDAEGRMVLADVLAYAARLEPTLCVDFATLTGAAPRAIGKHRGTVFTNRESLRKVAMDAGEASGEPVWTFPIDATYRRELKSDYADILQCSHGNYCDHIYAATFLSHFIGDKSPWLHLDLSPSEKKGGLGLAATDTTGFGLRWALECVRRALARSKGKETAAKA